MEQRDTRKYGQQLGFIVVATFAVVLSLESAIWLSPKKCTVNPGGLVQLSLIVDLIADA